MNVEATLSQFAALVSLFTNVLVTVIKRLPDIGETIKRAEGDEATLADGLLSVLLSLTGEKKEPQPEAAPVPEATVLTVEVFHEFELDGEAYDVAEVKWTTGEKPPTVEQAIKAADADGRVVRSDAEWNRAYEHRQKLPKKLNSRWLFTAQPPPGGLRLIFYLNRGRSEWYWGWGYLGRPWRGDGLVLRRRT